MELPFFKYQGTGNDFVMIDNRLNTFHKNNTEMIAKMCDRKFGVGGDGLILLESHPEVDFKMVYYNSDGNLSSMCGNGGRCIALFAKHLGIIEERAVFEAVDGLHKVTITDENVSLKMNDVQNVLVRENTVFLDTGSPHHVEVVKDLKVFDVKTKGANIRYNTYGKEGANVNFVQSEGNDTFSVRTYERGVEDETLSCGTGVTAVAIAMFELKATKSNTITLRTPGGNLKVRFTKNKDSYENVFLEGPAKFVFKGIYS